MPRFFFHIREGETYIADDEGGEFADLETARAEAAEIAREFIIERLRNRQKVDGRRIEIADADGTVLSTLAMRDVLD